LGRSRINVSLSLDKDILGLKVMIATQVKSPSAFSYDREIMRQTLDVCRLGNGLIGNFISKMVYDILKNYSNYFFECPVKKDGYYARNLMFPSNFKDYLPPGILRVILKEEIFFKTSLVAKFRVSKVKGLVLGFNITSFGSVGL
jgi:Protein of unknown function (DUF1091)